MGQGRRVVEVAARHQMPGLVRVAGADTDLVGRHPLQQALDDRTAKLARRPGDDDHEILRLYQ
jgi:hypothetical protein